MFQNRTRSTKTLPLMILLLIIPAIFAPMLLHMISQRGADYQPHIAWAFQIAEGTHEILPHPLFHFGVILTHAILPGGSFTLAGFVFAMLLYLFIGAVLYLVYIRPVFGTRLTWKTGLVAIFVTLSLMTVSAVTIFTWGSHNLYWGYLLPNMYHNPTLTTLRPLTLLLFVYILGIFSAKPFYQSWLAVLIAALLTVLTTFAKPHYAIAALPAIGLVVLYRLHRRQLIHWPLLIFGVGLPAAAVIIIQMLMLRTSSVGGGSIVFAPFELFEMWSADNLLLKLVMSILFPLAVYGFYFQKAREDLSFNLSWLTFIFGASYTYFLAESERVTDGNFIWSSQITLFMLFVVSAVFFLRQIYEPGKGFTFSRAAIICIVIWLLHLASGVLWYATEITTVTFAQRWW